MQCSSKWCGYSQQKGKFWFSIVFLSFSFFPFFCKHAEPLSGTIEDFAWLYRKPTRLGVAQIRFASATSGWGEFASCLHRLGHVSKCFGKVGDRNDSCSSLCEKRTGKPEDGCRLCVGQRSFGRDWRGVAAVWHLPAGGLGVSAVQEETEVRRTLGQNTYGSGDCKRQFAEIIWIGQYSFLCLSPGTVCEVLQYIMI